MTLYEINNELETAFYNCIDPETGEIVGGTEELDRLQMERNEKIENTALFIKNLKAEAEMIQAEERRLTARRRTCENRAEWLKKYLADNLQGETFKSARTAISYRRTQSLNVTDIWKVPEEYVTIPDPVPDKRAITAALKAGEKIEGAELVDNMSMIVR